MNEMPENEIASEDEVPGNLPLNARVEVLR